MSDQLPPDATLGVEFFLEAVEHPAKSREAGRPICEDREFVRIRFPGDSKRELVAPAHEMHYVSAERRQMTYAERFAPAYEAFKAGITAYQSGTPLSSVGFLTPARRTELQALNIVTVEQLAGLDHRALGRLGMGARALMEEAQRYLAQANDVARTASLEAEVARLRALVEAQAAPAQEPDPFDGFGDDDLANMIRDAGQEPPRRGGRAALIRTLREIGEARARATA